MFSAPRSLAILLFVSVLLGCTKPLTEPVDARSPADTGLRDVGADDVGHSDDSSTPDVGEDVSDGDVGPDASEDVVEERPVQFISPTDGAVLSNPVTFEIEANGPSTVQIEADEWPLSEPWDPEQNSTLTYTFAGTGFEREVVLFGYGADGAEMGRDRIYITVAE